jgi:hypothetical protein
MVEMYKCFRGICCLHPQARRQDVIITPSRTSTSNSMKSTGGQMKSDLQAHRKGKGHPCHVYASTEERRIYSSNPFATSAPEEGCGQQNHPTALAPRKTRCQLYRRPGGTQGRSRRARKSRRHRNSISRRPRPQRVTILTKLSRPIPDTTTESKFREYER